MGGLYIKSEEGGRVGYFRTQPRHPDYLAHEDFRCEVTLVFGLPGAGKDS